MCQQSFYEDAGASTSTIPEIMPVPATTQCVCWEGGARRALAVAACPLKRYVRMAALTMRRQLWGRSSAYVLCKQARQGTSQYKRVLEYLSRYGIR